MREISFEDIREIHGVYKLANLDKSAVSIDDIIPIEKNMAQFRLSL